MLTQEELIYFTVTLGILWIFPLISLFKTGWKVLVINFLIQVFYSLFFLWLMDNYGSKGSGLLWMFYWLVSIIIHLAGLNIWIISKWIKRKSRATKKA